MQHSYTHTLVQLLLLTGVLQTHLDFNLGLFKLNITIVDVMLNVSHVFVQKWCRKDSGLPTLAVVSAAVKGLSYLWNVDYFHTLFPSCWHIPTTYNMLCSTCCSFAVIQWFHISSPVSTLVISVPSPACSQLPALVDVLSLSSFLYVVAFKFKII